MNRKLIIIMILSTIFCISSIFIGCTKSQSTNTTNNQNKSYDNKDNNYKQVYSISEDKIESDIAKAYNDKDNNNAIARDVLDFHKSVCKYREKKDTSIDNKKESMKKLMEQLHEVTRRGGYRIMFENNDKELAEVLNKDVDDSINFISEFVKNNTDIDMSLEQIKSAQKTMYLKKFNNDNDNQVMSYTVHEFQQLELDSVYSSQQLSRTKDYITGDIYTCKKYVYDTNKYAQNPEDVKEYVKKLLDVTSKKHNINLESVKQD